MPPKPKRQRSPPRKRKSRSRSPSPSPSKAKKSRQKSPPKNSAAAAAAASASSSESKGSGGGGARPASLMEYLTSLGMHSDVSKDVILPYTECHQQFQDIQEQRLCECKRLIDAILTLPKTIHSTNFRPINIRTIDIELDDGPHVWAERNPETKEDYTFAIVKKWGDKQEPISKTDLLKYFCTIIAEYYNSINWQDSRSPKSQWGKRSPFYTVKVKLWPEMYSGQSKPVHYPFPIDGSWWYGTRDWGFDYVNWTYKTEFELSPDKFKPAYEEKWSTVFNTKLPKT
jgi:hypothetical protein